MSTKVKTIIGIIVGAILSLALVCAYGFTIGGQRNSYYIIFCIICGLLISFVGIIFSQSFSYVKSSQGILPLIFAAITVYYLMMFSYNAINNLTKEKEYIEYDTEIVNIDNSGYHNPRSFCFKDKQGNIIEFQESDIASTFDGSPEVGATATVREYKGGFGYTSYEIVKIENEPKILP